MSDIVDALGPGKKLDSITSFAPDYLSVRRAFNDLLVFPHLESIEIDDAFKTNFTVSRHRRKQAILGIV